MPCINSIIIILIVISKEEVEFGIFIENPLYFLGAMLSCKIQSSKQIVKKKTLQINQHPHLQTFRKKILEVQHFFSNFGIIAYNNIKELFYI